MDKTVILNLRNLRDNLTNEQVVNHIRRLMHRILTVDVRIADEPSVAEKPAWLKGHSDVEWSYNVIAEWLSRCDKGDGTRIIATIGQYAELERLIFAVLPAARQAAAQDAYERACKAMCGHCRRLVAVECLPVHGWVHFVNDGLQPRGEAGRYADCQAAAIRALAAAEAGVRRQATSSAATERREERMK